MDTPLGSPKPKLLTGAKRSNIKFLTRYHCPSRAGALVRVTASPIAGLHHLSRLSPIYLPISLVFYSNTCICTLSSVLCPTVVLFWVFLIFPTPNNIYKYSGVVLSPLAPCFIFQISYSCDLLLFGFYGSQRFNIFSHFECICCYYIGEISCMPLLHSSIQICIHCVCCPDR